MRFKIHSTIFVFIACFLLLSYAPIQGEMQERTISKPCFRGDTLTKDQEDSFIKHIAALNKFYEDKEFEKIGKFYKETGVLTKHNQKKIKGDKMIAAYFGELHKREVRDIKFTLECVYAQELKDTVGNLLKRKIIQKKYIPIGVKLSDMATHTAFAIISYSFTLEGKKYNQGPGSDWDGIHIQGCPIF